MAAITETQAKRAVKKVMTKQDLHDEALFCCITSAITLAKEHQVKRVTTLRAMLIDRGFEAELAQDALVEIGKRIKID